MPDTVHELLATEVALARLGARNISADEAVQLRILVSVEGEDARRLERIAEQRGKTPHDLVADLLRAADRSAA